MPWSAPVPPLAAKVINNRHQRSDQDHENAPSGSWCLAFRHGATAEKQGGKANSVRTRRRVAQKKPRPALLSWGSLCGRAQTSSDRLRW